MITRLPRLFLPAVLFILSLSAHAQTISLPEGTNIRLESVTAFNPALYSPGNTFDFRVREDIVIDNQVVIKRGTIVPALIRRLEDPDYIGEPGYVELSFKKVKAVDGQKIPLRSAVFRIEGKSRKKTSLILSIFLDIFLLLKGEPAYIDAGTQMVIATADEARVRL